MKTKFTSKKTIVLAVASVLVSTGLASVEGYAATKTSKAANALVNFLPMTSAQKALLKANIMIYDDVGCQAGRYLIIRKYGQVADPGKCR